MTMKKTLILCLCSINFKNRRILMGNFHRSKTRWTSNTSNNNPRPTPKECHPCNLQTTDKASNTTSSNSRTCHWDHHQPPQEKAIETWDQVPQLLQARLEDSWIKTRPSKERECTTVEVSVGTITILISTRTRRTIQGSLRARTSWTSVAPPPRRWYLRGMDCWCLEDQPSLR
mgnify:CR=1 FL=1